MAHPRSSSATRSAPLSPEPLADAFHDLHGRRLHGFSLLLTLGDRALAARLTADALAEGAARAAELRHPERAAAWLRRRVVRDVPRRRRAPSPAEERGAFEEMDVDPAVIDGLAALSVSERAALIAADVERLDPRDVETVAGRGGAAGERLLVRARRRYVDGYASVPIAAEPGEDGLLVRRIHAVAARAMT